MHTGTNTYLIGTGPKRILIDAGQGIPTYLPILQGVLASENCEVETLLITHFHGDHTMGIPDLVNGLSPRPTLRKNLSVLHTSAAWGKVQDISNGQTFKVDGASLKAFHCPGHTGDHMAFVLLEEGALFTGDNVLGHGTAVFEDLPLYVSSLAAMRDSPDVKGRGYPGHGAVIEDIRAKCDEYISHRAQREREVVEVLTRPGRVPLGQTDQGIGALDLVREIYRDTPENLHFAASRGVVQILEKLVGEGKVVHDEEENVWFPTKKAVL
jgi:endoribonuclease LACTB2